MLRYTLTPYERAFTFQILSQDSAIKDAIASVGGSFVTSNGWTISIKRSPEIKVVSKRIFLRGSNKLNDMRIDRTWNIPSNFKVNQYISQINQALAEIISFANQYKSNVEPYGVQLIEYLNTYHNFDTYFMQNGLPIVNWTSEVQVIYDKDTSFHIDADGWGNNKLKEEHS